MVNATGTGYAALRMANDNGRIDTSGAPDVEQFPTNVHIGKVVARSGGRGIFCVSRSGGAVIDEIEIEHTGSDAILIQDCFNVTVAAESGVVTGGGAVVVADNPNNDPAIGSDIRIQNLTITDSAVVEDPCFPNTELSDLVLQRTRVDVCD